MVPFSPNRHANQSRIDNIPVLNKSLTSQRINIAGTFLDTTPVFDAYWYFAAERQRIFFRRFSGLSRPALTLDPILSEFKFTNAYRASDRVSQYLIRNVIYRTGLSPDDENILFRILLFKLFNKIETWESLESEFGEITLANYEYESFNKFLSYRQDSGLRNYSAAYIMPSPGRFFGRRRKHSNHLRLIEWILNEGFAEKLSGFSSMRDGYELLMSAPSLGPFLAYQFITDINYSPLTRFSEQEFVVAGPGALDGISKCFVDTKEIPASEIIQNFARHQEKYFAHYEIKFDGLWGRRLQLIDCQNLFCEISKYSRVAFPEVTGLAGRTRIKQKYRPSGTIVNPWYPPDWEINDLIDKCSHSDLADGSEIPTAQQLIMAL